MWCRRLLVVGAVLLLGIALSGVAQADERDGGAPTVTTAVRVGESPPLRELADIPVPEPTSLKDREIPIFIPEFLRELPDVSEGPDPLRQERPGLAQPSALFDFEGYGSDDNQTLFGYRIAPPDSQGDIGPNHYVSWNNIGYYVYDDLGNPLLGPVPGNALWTGFGGFCETDNAGDPIVLYDHLADRWLFSQFVSSSSDGHQCIAISQTPDPLGTYFLYDFIVSPSAFNDYPKIGVWPDGYYMTANEFTGGFAGARIVAFERPQMLTGGVAQMVSFFLPNATPEYYAVQPGHLEGPPPAPGTPNPYVMACDDAIWGCGAGGSDGYHLWDFHVDWVTPGLSTFTYNTFLVSANFDGNLCGFSSCVPQPGTAQTLDSLGQFTMYRAQYRNFGTHETIVVSHTVDVDGADTAGVRWAEIRDTGGGGWTLRQAGTYDLGDGVHRWMPSAAMDGKGSCLCIIYSASDGTAVYPSLRYACHEEGVDPLGVMGAEQECVAGGGAQTGTSRWGDYGALSLDPDDQCTFWGTGEYVAVGGSYFWNTRVCVWNCPSCLEDYGTLEGTVDDGVDPIDGAQVQAGGFSATTNPSGFYTMEVPEDTYSVTASKYGYLPDTAVGVSVTAGMTTVQDFSLSLAPTYTLDGTVTDCAGAGWSLYARVDVTVAGGGPLVATVYTDPADGTYATTIVGGTTYDLVATALIPGYAPTAVNGVLISGDTTQDFCMVLDGTCNAAGYGPSVALIDEDFEGPWIPAGWTVIDNASSGPVWTNLAGCGEGGNFTNGSGDLACVSSDNFGTAEFDTELLTPTFGPLGATVLSFTANYQNFAGYDYFEVDLKNGAAPWATVLSWNEDHGGFRAQPGEDVVIPLGATDSGSMVRFHYFDPNTGDYDWYIQVDDVWIGDPACIFEGGSIFYGNVYDANTLDPIVDAMVDVDNGGSTDTVATPDDDNLDDGFYVLYAPLNGGGSRTLTASFDGYDDAVGVTTPTTGAWNLMDFNLCAGLVAATPSSLYLRPNVVPPGGSATVDTVPLTLDNTGCADADFAIVEFDVAAVAAVGPAQSGQPVDNSWRMLRETDRAAWRKSTARSAEGVDMPAMPHLPVSLGAGDLVASYPTGLTFPWGLGYNKGTNDLLWVSDLAAAGGTDFNYEYLTDPFGVTGNTIDFSGLGAVFMADMAYHTYSGMFWQVDVGGSDCILEFDPVALAFTGGAICPAFGTSMRGVAYDPVSDTYWAGTWNNGGFIVQFDDSGAILGQWNNGLAVAGLAFNPATGHLFAIANTDGLLDIVVFDATDPALPALFGFSSGMPDFSQGGLGFDCDGNLWMVNQTTLEVWEIESGETGVCDVFEVDWLSEDPVSGTVGATVKAQVQVDVTCDPTGQTPGLHQATLLVDTETPYAADEALVDCVVAFLDVGDGYWADDFIHGLAGAGVTNGCGAGNFCPDLDINRAQMAVWLLRAKYGADYDPPNATGLIFNDVGSEDFAADFIEDLFNRGIVVGCGSGNYCPNNPVTRAQMAVFLLATLEGDDLVVGACQGDIFGDVTGGPFCWFIEELYRRGITAGCAGGNYCPNDPVTRAQMAIFTTGTFGLPYYGMP
ncbi:MAG: hypothetical protein GY856_06635 [bacterium]|nr:hypothetical protein [bacterium]